MKNRILLYLITIISTLSLQSCVTNYVVSQPATYIKEYKTNAKTYQAEAKKLEEDKKVLTASFASLSAKESKAAPVAVKAVSARTKTIDGILAEAETYLGTRYSYGGMTRNGIDCSAFVLSAYSAAGITLPRVAADQSTKGERVEKENLQKGDLLFFSQGSRISHVAMVYEVTPEGEVKFIHSASSKGVSFSSLNSSYWSPKFRFAKRIVTEDSAPNTATAMN